VVRARGLRYICVMMNQFIPIVALACWLGGACAQERAQEPTSSTVRIFDGATLNGWKPVDPDDAKYWTVSDSCIVGGDGQQNVPKNTYLQTTREFKDFELRCLFRLTGDHSTGFINSGIQYRSAVSGKDIVGYQADIGRGLWGAIYDEHRRGLLGVGDLSTLKRILKEDGWNSYIVRVRGDHHELYINGVKTCDYIERDGDIPREGVIAFQLHSGGAAQIEIRDITITEFP